MQIKDARKKKRLSQEDLAAVVGKSRKMIGRYEKGTDAPAMDVLGKIAMELAIGEISINGYRFSVARQAESAEEQTPVATRQLQLDFDTAHVYHTAILNITQNKITISITEMIAGVAS